MLKAPFPYFGGKASVAQIVWEALGDVKSYIEPFCGSCAVLLARPNYDVSKHVETINDKDGFIANIWRSISKYPDEVAKYCDYPVSAIDLYSRTNVLVENKETLIQKLLEDDEYCDPKLAGYWIWCASNTIGALSLSKKKKYNLENNSICNMPHLSKRGMGISKISIRDIISNSMKNENIYKWIQDLSVRLRYVRTFCGNWLSVCQGKWQDDLGNVGIFFDPPYTHKIRTKNLYNVDEDVAGDVREWCKERGSNKKYRIVLAGYYEEHEELLSLGWKVYRWNAQGGYGNNKKNGEYINKYKESLFFSPYCQDIKQKEMF